MGKHPDLPDTTCPYDLYRVPGHRTSEVIDYLTYEISLECRNCGDRGPKEVIFHPNPWDGKRERYYHIGCDGCNMHAFDICVFDKRAVAFGYRSNHPLRGRIDQVDVKTRSKY